ncbi:MAG: hypothetical protein HC828_07275 [Blastochloris sp.]|nr:hypothetical protein [Blastochloris sp.]
MYAAIRRLDELQDDDPTDHPLPFATLPGVRYHLVLALYALADSVLDDLPDSLAPERRLRLRRFWNDTMLRMADGQQRDLLAPHQETPLTLDAYQAIAQAKTGANLCPRLSGVAAVLTTDDSHVIQTLTRCGEIYGTLLQYHDDILDAAMQATTAPTLPAALHAHPLMQQTEAPHQTLSHFWAHLYPHYRTAVHQGLRTMPPRVQDALTHLFQAVFEAPREE